MNNKNQIGCVYCIYEECCLIRTFDINRAELDCPKFIHYSDKKPNELTYLTNTWKELLYEWEKERISLPPLKKINDDK